MKPALLVIDMQYWFFKIDLFSTTEGKMILDSLVKNINELTEFFHSFNLPIFHITTEHKKDGSTLDLWGQRNNSTVLLEGSPDIEELDKLKIYPSDMKIIKTRHSAFIRTDLEEKLKLLGIDTLVITGYSTNSCVGETAIDSYNYDFDVLLAKDAILGPDPIRANTMLCL